jgi:peptidoglycan/xylan/chitin deacetylase (PgdA/CDA1 family)
MGLIEEQQRRPPRQQPEGEPRREPRVRALLRRYRPAGVRLLVNWGVLVLAVAVVLAVRYRTEADARAPLPAPAVHLSAADTRTWRAFPAYRGVVPVLVYHGINASGNAIATTPQVFAEQMLALKTAGFHAITLSQYVKFVHGDYTGLPSKPILLTFDDGRLDTYRAANNVLRKYGFHGTMFTFAAWPTLNPGFNLRWNELRSMQASGIWSVEEHGGHGHEYVRYNAKGNTGGVYAFREYFPNAKGNGGHLESFAAFRERVTSSILWGTQRFGTEIPGYRPTAFAVPEADYGQAETNDPRIPRFMLPWLSHHFAVVFGGDYLSGETNQPILARFTPGYSYRITMGPKETLSALGCRLRGWVNAIPIWKEYACIRPHLPHPYLRAPLP